MFQFGSMKPPRTGAQKPARLPIMFIDPDTVPAYLPPTSMHDPQAGGITRSLQKLAMPIAAMAQRGSARLMEITIRIDAPRNPPQAIRRRPMRTLPAHFAMRSASVPERSDPRPPHRKSMF